MKQIKMLIISAVVLLVLAACASKAAPTTPAGFPIGKFIKSGTTEYGLLFNPDGSFSVFEGDNTYVNGTYTADDNVFTETSNDGNCKTNVSFNYAFDGKNLTISYVSNPEDDTACTGRYADFNNVTYTIAN